MWATEFSLFLNRLHFIVAFIRLEFTGWLRDRCMRLMWGPRLWFLLLFHEISPEWSPVGHTLGLTFFQTIVATFIEWNLNRFKGAVLASYGAMGFECHYLGSYASLARIILILFGFCSIGFKFEISIRLLLVVASILQFFYVCIDIRLFVRVCIERILFHRFFTTGWKRISSFESILEEV